MLTFDALSTPISPLEELTASALPDAIEIGENNDCWLYVRRSKKQIELVSKQTGRLVAFCPVDEQAINFGVSPRQISAAKGALSLGVGTSHDGP